MSGRWFYGWTVVGAAWIVLFVAYGLQFSYGVFVTAIGEELGWTRSETALPFSLYVLVYSALSSATGSATDRFGPRRVISFGAILLGVGWGLSSRVTQPWQLALTLGLVAALGMSVTWAPCNGTVVKWFSRLRGSAAAISTTGGSLAGFVVPAAAGAAVAAFGWRSTLLVMAISAAILIAIAASFMVRDPATMGLHPDGDAHAPSLQPSLDVSAIRWSRPFLLIVGAYGLTWLTVFIPFVHLAAFAEDLGSTPVRAATVLSAMGLGGFFGRLIAGAVSDRLGRFPTLVTMFFGEMVAFAVFAIADDIGLLWIGSALFGFTYGGGVALFSPLCGDIFGPQHAGAIVGAAFARAGSTAAVGPWLAAWLYDSTGSYQPAFLIGIGANLMGLLLVLALARDRRV